MSPTEYPIPFSDIDTIVKQVNPDPLNDIGREALNIAFTGFFSRDQEAIDTAAARPSQIADNLHIHDEFDPNPARRFAGDRVAPAWPLLLSMSGRGRL